MPRQNVLDHTGHTPHAWDKADTVAVKEAEARFKELTGKGYWASEPGPNGEAGRLLKSFDPNVETTNFMPQLIGG